MLKTGITFTGKAGISVNQFAPLLSWIGSCFTHEKCHNVRSVSAFIYHQIAQHSELLKGNHTLITLLLVTYFTSLTCYFSFSFERHVNMKTDVLLFCHNAISKCGYWRYHVPQRLLTLLLSRELHKQLLYPAILHSVAHTLYEPKVAWHCWRLDYNVTPAAPRAWEWNTHFLCFFFDKCFSIPPPLKVQ